MSFSDDAGNDESLTSEATEAVSAAEPSEPPDKPRGLSGTASHDRLVLTWDDPQDDSITGYVILRRVRVNDQGGDFGVLVANTGSAATLHRRHGGGRHHVHLPHQGHQRGRSE